MLTSARRRPVRWIAAIALTASAALVPVATASTADAAFNSDACGTKLAKSSGGTWSCSFVDNFDGTSLDTTKWVYQDTALTGFTVSATCFRPGQNVQVRGGVLRLLVTKSATPRTCKSPVGDFSTPYQGADISTWGKFSQTYGRFEARVKFPSYRGAGLHSGFWLNPQDSAYGAWPNSGEVNIAEFFSVWADRAFPTLHYPGSTVNDTGIDCMIGSLDVFHTYAVEWSSTKMTFSLDGKACFTRSWVPSSPLVAPQPFDKRFYVSLTAIAGGGANAPTSATPFPATTAVDYVKVWY
jgi:beta-glucanase (GH16 family)